MIDPGDDEFFIHLFGDFPSFPEDQILVIYLNGSWKSPFLAKGSMAKTSPPGPAQENMGVNRLSTSGGALINIACFLQRLVKAFDPYMTFFNLHPNPSRVIVSSLF